MEPTAIRIAYGLESSVPSSVLKRLGKKVLDGRRTGKAGFPNKPWMEPVTDIDKQLYNVTFEVIETDLVITDARKTKAKPKRK